MESIPLGMLFTMIEDTVYALPAKQCRIYSNTAGATFIQSNDEAFASSTAVTLTEGAAYVSGAFIQSTADNALVILKGG